MFVESVTCLAESYEIHRIDADWLRVEKGFPDLKDAKFSCA